MSDVTTGSAFNPQFFMNPPWWLGRVESKETWSDNIQGETFTSVSGIQGWGHRYKVRVFNWHTGEIDKLAPKDMAFCQVIMPVTAGTGHGGASQSPSLESGSVVFGFFMDGMAGQEGYIVGVLGNSNNNVPTERGQPAPNAPGAPQPPPPGSPPGTPPTPPSQPPTPRTGPGSLGNVPVPPNVDQLSVSQLTKLLDPSKTPSSSTFQAASEARQKYKNEQKLKGLPVNKAEEERQALIATVKASRQPGGAAGSTGNCNKGYQQFNDTYTDGDQMRSAKVPDDRIVGGQKLSTTEALHIEVSSKTNQQKDSKIKLPLLDVAKKNNSEMKGIQRIMKNLLNDVEELKKEFNQVSAFATEVSEFSNKILEKVTGATDQIAGFIKYIMEGVRGYILRETSSRIKKVAPFLFPSEYPKLYKKVEECNSLINCLFNRLVDGLKGLISGLLSDLLDRFINAPLCAAEGLLGNLLNKVLGPIASTLQAALAPISALLGSIGGLTSLISSGQIKLGQFGDIGGLFNALEFIPGILKFFKCDDEPDVIQYNEISQDTSALPGGDATQTPTDPTNESATGTGANASQPVSANVVNNTSGLDSAFSTPITQAERDAVSRGEILGGGTITSRGNIRNTIEE